jgi:small subunit ribosomal protein S17
MKQDKGKDKKGNEKENVKTGSVKCNDEKCPVHGTLPVRGRRFKGYVTKIYSKNATIEFERFTYIPKYERYAKAKTRLHAHIPECIVPSVKIGSYVEIGECRPLSKTIHHVITSIGNNAVVNPEK